MNNEKLNGIKPVDVNGHLHTPYSFSAFDSIPQALDMAVEEGVKVVGINDFYTIKGYGEWNDECARRKLYPLFNIEFISLQEDDQKNGVRVNDPNNPGRTYISGKGLAFPTTLKEPYASKLKNVAKESNLQVRSMNEKLNGLLKSMNAGFSLDINRIEKELTKGSIRERHLAKALRIEAYSFFKNDDARIKEFFRNIFGGKELKSVVDDVGGVENEIRGNLLKAGGAAFVPEDPKAFLPMEDVRQIIISAGGIPTYPFLADDAKGGFTDFEEDVARAASILNGRGFYSAEFITTRNSIEVLERYLEYLWDKGFIITLGTEHNTPAMEPVRLYARGGAELTDKIKKISYWSTCVVAAHQEAVRAGEKGYIDADGKVDVANRDRYVIKGDEIIKKAIG